MEKEMATHSSVLAWRIPGTGKPGGLPSMGSHRADTTKVMQQQQWILGWMHLFRPCFSPNICRGVGLQGHMVTLGEGNDNPSSILTWKIPWTIPWRSLAGYKVDSKESDMTDWACMHTHGSSIFSVLRNIRWIIEKAREFQKNIYFCFIDYAKGFDCLDHNKLENSERDGNTRPPDLPLEKFVCRSGSNS